MASYVRYLKFAFALLIVIWTILNFALQVHQPANPGESYYQNVIDLVSGQIFSLVVLYTIMGVSCTLIADVRGSVADSMMATFVNLSIWFSWWIQLYWLVLLIFKVGGAFDNICQYIDQVNTFYCDTGRTVGAFTIIFFILQTGLVVLSAYEAHTQSQTRRVEPTSKLLLGLVATGFVGQFLWSCAILSLSNQSDAFLAIDFQLLLDVVLINLVFTIYVGFLARVIYGGTQAVGHLAMLVSAASACLGWSLLITDGRRLSDSTVYLAFGGGGMPPCNGGVYCGEAIVMFVALLAITLSQTFAALAIANMMKNLPQESNSRHDLLLNNSSDPGTYQPVTVNQRASSRIG